MQRNIADNLTNFNKYQYKDMYFSKGGCGLGMEMANQLELISVYAGGKRVN